MTTWSIINGKQHPADATYTVTNPASGEPIDSVGRSERTDVNAAVEAALAAGRLWSQKPVEDRSKTLVKLAEKIEDNCDRLAAIETEDCGKPLAQARNDAMVCASYFRFFGNAIMTYYGSQIPIDDSTLAYTKREPFGVVGSILAWNYPMQLLGRSVAAALATGNTCVVKPADETPRTAVEIALLAVEAGLPPGALNIVTGLGQGAGQAISEHPDITLMGFVGSPETGAKVATAAAKRLIPSVMELGGKSAHVVFSDANIEKAAAAITKGILQNAGQTCSAGSRVIVHASIEESLLEKLVKEFERMSTGPGEKGHDVGPLISMKQRDRVHSLVQAPHGGRVVIGGRFASGEGTTDGSFYEPTIIRGVDPKSQIAQEEVFGPVLVVTTFETKEEAIKLANDTEYALLGAVWTNDITTAHNAADQILAGQVFINSYGVGGGVGIPFGGWKKSGYGREKGIDALNEFTQSKSIIVAL